MTKPALALLIALILGSCTSVKQYNQQLAEKKNPKDLQEDVDYLYRKLQAYHPQLYWYISKKELDYKFDSLKSSITEPMTSGEFYYKVAPVVSSIREGHTRMLPLNKEYKSREKDSLRVKEFGYTPFSKLKFGIFDNRLYVVKNNSWNKTIKEGSEVVSVNGISAQHLLTKYRTTLTADGYVTTFTDRLLGNRFPTFFYNDFDFADSLACELRHNDTLRNVLLRRAAPKDTAKGNANVKKVKVTLTAAQRDSARSERKRRLLLGYNSDEKTYSKNLSFYKSDSSIAIMKLNDFTGGQYEKFYKSAFKKLDSLKVKTLVIDLRNNTGGSLFDVRCLYSYLADTSFCFIKKMEVTTPKSILFTTYFKDVPLVLDPFILPFYPVYFTYALSHMSKGDDGKYYFRLGKKVEKPRETRFRGKVYMLINGASFSASCIISSNLKGAKRAYFVGEETGGAFNGNVAGRMHLFELPNSKLNARIGLLCMRPEYQTEQEGRGIIPDVAITPTLDDVLKGNDPELNWVIDRVKQERGMAR
ncbi:S41 family peptidase [uncultured Acetobacteroides sp.]|uniref:S41 family peptidase n=1 Tax=uncultured Acetobacteroides sp. TaxID=1760811 RepID=UPI0029F5079E|nr:S41 family peptidase [uncultured Acetobacteroides sp.]